jgi:hypothetical protein
MTTPHQPLFLKIDDLPRLRPGWVARQVKDISGLLNSGKLYDENTVSDEGSVPVVNQSPDSWHGFHNEEPGVVASEEQPVSTFANHTCAMRLMKQPFSCIQNVFSRTGKLGVCDTTFLHYATLGRVQVSGYKGHHPLYRDAWIPVPERIEVQKKIGKFVSAFDELIDNNRRRMALLAMAAWQLFREWFVKLHFPGHEHTAINEGVPDGWERRYLGQMLTLKRGYDLPETRRVRGDVPIVSSSGITGYHNEKKAAAPGIVTGRYGTIGEVFFVQQDYWPLNTALYVSDLKDNPPSFLAHLLKHALDGTQSDKSAVPGVNRNVLHRLTVLSPTRQLTHHFDEFAYLTYQQIHSLETANQKLRAARDLLLPRLMSGDIVV